MQEKGPKPFSRAFHPFLLHSYSSNFQFLHLMKTKRIYTKLLLAGSMVLMSGALASCDDFLTVLPTNQLPEESFWQDKSDLEGVRAGAYNQFSSGNVTSRILYWGEIRSDNLEQNDMTQTGITYVKDGVLQPSNGMFDWGAFYKGINYCNLILEQGDKMTTPGQEVDPGFSRSDWTPYQAEVTSLRALYYFYLVRAFRDVPYITKSIRSDKEARNDLPAQQPGVAIMGQLIEDVEAVADKAPTNYGPTIDNKGRFTKRSAHALLADMYLWRACMLKNFMNKTNHGRVNFSDIALNEGTDSVTYTTANGTKINASYTDNLAESCFKKAIEHADYVINDLKKDYDKDLQTAINPSKEEKEQPYPLILHPEVFGTTGVSDRVYSRIFGSGNSTESLFEVQYDGTTSFNTTFNTYLSGQTNGVYGAGYMAAANVMYSGAANSDPAVGFGKTDYRLLESLNYFSKESRKPVAKFLTSSVEIPNKEDVTEELANVSDMSTSIYSWRNINNCGWPVYRLTDVMLIKAEAIARCSSPSPTDLEEGYQLTNQIFKRNNPGLVGHDDAEASTCTGNREYLLSYRVDKLSTDANSNYVKTYKPTFSQSNLLALVYHERQREFFGEGKRWFDIVRQVEASNDPKATLTDFITLKNSVKARLTQLYSFYNPVYSEEIKVNGAETGGHLVQNPVWDRYTKK